MHFQARHTVRALPLLAATAVLTLAACGKKQPPVSIFPLVGKEDIQIGGTLYKQYCGMCHGEPNTGNKPTFPPLAESYIVKGDPIPFAETILYGKGHRAKPGAPHFFEGLKDAEIARIGNYLKAEAGATENPMRAKTVERAREIYATEHPNAPKPPEARRAPDNGKAPEAPDQKPKDKTAVPAW